MELVRKEDESPGRYSILSWRNGWCKSVQARKSKTSSRASGRSYGLRKASVMAGGVHKRLVIEGLKAFNKCLLSTSPCQVLR